MNKKKRLIFRGQFKRIFSIILATTVAMGTLTGCGKKQQDADSGEEATGGKEEVVLVVWGAEEDQQMLAQMLRQFQKDHDEVNWTIQLGVESEANTKDDILADKEAAADVFAFADDQLKALVDAEVLEEVTQNADTIIEDNGGVDNDAVKAASLDGKLYAYPMTADNGYFLFYNKEYLRKKDIATFDGMLGVAKKEGKKISMPIDEAWYLFSFFSGAGLDLYLDEDGVNYCNWNSMEGKYTGVDVAKAIIRITQENSFANIADKDFITAVQEDKIIAGISGNWNAQAVEEAWNVDYGAAKLPTFTCKGQQVQMGSFIGYKLIGVNANCEYKEYATMLAEYLTNYENQVVRFEERGLRPTNVEAEQQAAVQENPAIAALTEQAPYATLQRINDNYWEPANVLGKALLTDDKTDEQLQTALNIAVSRIRAE